MKMMKVYEYEEEGRRRKVNIKSNRLARSNSFIFDKNKMKWRSNRFARSNIILF